MPNFLIKSAKLIAEPEKSSGIIRGLLLHINGGDGSIFSLVKILGKTDEKRKAIASIIDEHLTHFHETIEENANVPRRFEQILQAINEDIATHVKNSAPISLSDLHAIIGIVHKNQIFFSGIGNLSALFMHQTGKKRYVVYELEKQFDALEDLNWDRPFLTVLDGELNPGDVFYCASKISPREMDLGTLQDILITLPPAGGLKRIQQHVSFNTVYGGIIFKVQEPESSGQPKKINPLSSIEELNRTTQETGTLLGEQKPDFKNMAERLSSPLLKKLASPGSTGYKSTAKTIISALIKFFAFMLVLLWTGIKQMYRLTKQIIQIIYKAVSNQEKRHAVKTKISNLWNRMKDIPKTSKYIALSAAALIIILVGTIFMVQSGAEKRARAQEFETIAQTILDKADGAEASLIYDDKNQAKNLLTEAQSLLGSLSSTNNKQDEQIEELTMRLDSIYYKLRGVSEIEATEITSLENGSIIEAVEADGVVYAIAQNQIYKLTQPDLQLASIELTAGSIGMPQVSTGQGGNFLFIDSGQNLGLFSKDSNAINPVVSGIKNQNSAEDLVLYNDNLYVLSATDEQILKMRPQGSGYDAGTDWIQINDSDLSRARSLTIDGDIYVLTNNSIAKFTSGREVDFNLETVEPAMSNPRSIWTTVGTDYLYILEPDESRVIVYRKDGSLVAQYVNEHLSDAIAMIVQEANNTILFTTQNGIYSLAAEHLLQ